MSKFYPACSRLFFLMALLVLSACDRQAKQSGQQSEQHADVMSQNHMAGHDVYIWQRQWTTQHALALKQIRPYFKQLRILAAQQHPTEGWVIARVDFALLRQQPQAKIAVIRLDGRLAGLNQTWQIEKIMTLVESWRVQDIKLKGLEIDFDCPTARLAEYRQFIIQLRRVLGQEISLSITALPDWLSQPESLQQLLKQVDHSVLQVHAVQLPSQGLFDAKMAEHWIRQYAGLTPRNFYVALPAYHAQLTLSGQVESEVRLPESGQRQDLPSDVIEVARLIQQIEAQDLKNFKGWVWFRLPLPQDRNVWTWRSLKKVITRQPLIQQLDIEYQIKASPGQDEKLYDIYLKNSGDGSVPVPAGIIFQARRCISGDVLSSYGTLDIRPHQVGFVDAGKIQIRAGQQIYLGWLRCQDLNFKHFIEDY